MYTAKIKDRIFQYDVKNASGVTTDGRKISFEKINSRSFRLMMDGEEHIADLVHYDTLHKTITLRMGARKFVVEVKEPVDLFLDKIGIQLPTPKIQNNLRAPMPGLVLKVMVEKGQEVKKGDPLLILEAMKMENVFKAHADGKILDIHVVEKQAVEKGTELITFE